MSTMEEKTEEKSSRKCSSDEEIKALIQTLEKKKNFNGRWLHCYNGFWYPSRFSAEILRCRQTFQAADNDLIIATLPKSGTTWLVALTFSILNRRIFPLDQTPLLTSSPLSLLPFLEDEATHHRQQQNPGGPRMFFTHMPYTMLPGAVQQSAEDSACRVIHLCRSPLDQFVSLWHFLISNKDESIGVDGEEVTPAMSVEEAFDAYCNGIHGYGPFWDHILGYWNAHLKNPEKVMFLRYEDMKRDIVGHVKKIAEFVGQPFTEAEGAAAEKIAEMCSFERLKDLKVNKEGQTVKGMNNSTYFRKGEIGDWVNLLTPSMHSRLVEIMQAKFQGSGLHFV